jgi:hypothetical protein
VIGTGENGWNGTGFVCSNDEIGTGIRKKVESMWALAALMGQSMCVRLVMGRVVRKAWPQSVCLFRKQGTRGLPKVP